MYITKYCSRYYVIACECVSCVVAVVAMRHQIKDTAKTTLYPPRSYHLFYMLGNLQFPHSRSAEFNPLFASSDTWFQASATNDAKRLWQRLETLQKKATPAKKKKDNLFVITPHLYFCFYRAKKTCTLPLIGEKTPLLQLLLGNKKLIRQRRRHRLPHFRCPIKFFKRKISQ